MKMKLNKQQEYYANDEEGPFVIYEDEFLVKYMYAGMKQSYAEKLNIKPILLWPPELGEAPLGDDVTDEELRIRTLHSYYTVDDAIKYYSNIDKLLKPNEYTGMELQMLMFFYGMRDEHLKAKKEEIN